MSKFLEKAIKEMRNYGDMGLPDGETGCGMGSASNNKIVNAYKMNNILRRRNRAEEEEMNINNGMRDTEMSDDEVGMDDKDYNMDMGGDEAAMGVNGIEGDDVEMGGDVEEMKQFFQDNPDPSDEEVMQYADEHGMDMEDMRKEVYALIQSLLGGDSMDDEDGMGDEIEFSAPMNNDDGMPDEEDMQQGM